MSAKISDFDAIWIIYEYKNLFRQRGKMIWFSTKDIEDLYNYLQQNGRSGIRIYKGKYPNHPNFGNVNGAYDYRKEKTLVLMPTIEKEGVHFDEIPRDDIRKYVREIKDGNFPSPFAFNHGELCPPNCEGDEADENT